MTRSAAFVGRALARHPHPAGRALARHPHPAGRALARHPHLVGRALARHQHRPAESPPASPPPSALRWLAVLAVAFALVLGWLPPAAYAGLPETVARVKPSVVAVGTYQTTRRPPSVFRGTGFVVGDGRYVVTNNHVLPEVLDETNRERLAIFAGHGTAQDMRSAKVVARDTEHDLALLEIAGTPLKPLRLADGPAVKEGQDVAFTGFPVGMVLGLYHATHRGIIAAVSPMVIPGIGGKDLSAQAIKAMREPFDVYQLDATAYPGNSGSPVYDPETGDVIGVINSVFVKRTKEAVLTDPSGITYAIPVKFVKVLLGRAK